METRLVIFIFLLALFLLPDVSAQQIISTHERDSYPNNLSNSEFKSHVKSVKLTMYDDASDSTRSYQYIRTYNSKGLLMHEITNYYWEYYTDTIYRSYSYDSLDRPFSVTTICSKNWRECRNSYQELVYDNLGQYSHSIFTYDNSEPEPSFRCFYNEYGQYIRCEYRPTAEQHELGYNYDLIQQVFRYDDHGNCIEKVEIEDGDTVYIERNSYDENGNVIEYSYQCTSNNDPYTFRSIYYYNSDNLHIKTESFYDNTLHSVSRYEYDDQQLLQLGITYNNKGEIVSSFKWWYDERHNIVETIDFDPTGKAEHKFTYEYEYYE